MKAMGLDIGSVTVGVALSDELKMIANAYTVIRYSEENDDLYKQIVDIANNNNVDLIVVGMPYHMNKDESEGCIRSKRFIENIQKLTNIKIVTMDERMSTMAAQRSLLSFDVSRKNRKKVVDKVAAALILQNYLDTKSF